MKGFPHTLVRRHKMAVDKKNIFLSNTIEPLPYSSKSAPGSEKRIPQRDVNAHANFLKQRFEEIYTASLTQKQVAAIRYKEGTYLEFSSKKGHDLEIKSLENLNTGIRLLNVRLDDENDVVHATVYIPYGKESFFIDRVSKYLSTYNEKGKARHNNLVSSIEDVKLALLDAFWIGKKEDVPTDAPAWCEIWLRVEQEQYEEIESLFYECCRDLKIQYDERAIRFPERMIKLAYANAVQLSNLIGYSSFIAEIRRAPEITSFFDELTRSEQGEWVNDLLSRIDFNFSDISICILDTGVNSGHPLLSNAIEDETVQTVEPSWGDNDHAGHGTEMAGVALYNNLQDKLLSTNRNTIVHRVESVKILPPTGSNEPKLYGAITQRAVSLAEIGRPHFKRAICMAVTSERFNTNDGSPTSWSGAIDSITSGAEISKSDKRLFFVSAGNVYPTELAASGYTAANILHSVESPGQAWNAITVGAYSSLVQITDDLLSGHKAVADNGELSPYSSTSVTWDQRWPIKPEILLDGGNMATDGTNFTECADLSLLTTHSKPLSRLFTTTWGTSSATAQAAYMASQIMAEYPDIWPETIRALIVHSARWTQKMKDQFCQPDTKTKGRRNLLRSCGYGIPDLGRAIQCMENHVNLVIEGELQPFEKSSMKEMHIHRIPWPKEVLQSLGVIPATMRVTLSYFIEPGPGEVGWKDKYRYPSCGLRFDVINQNETQTDFVKRVNVKMRGDDKKDKGEGTSGSEYWYLGSDNRDVGSIHSDFREQNAVDLCDANYIAVYPVIGWWRERTHLKRYNDKIRYSLIISISTPKVDTDLYTPVITQIKTPVPTAVEVDIPVQTRNLRQAKPR